MAASSADLEATKPLLEAWGIASSASLDRVAHPVRSPRLSENDQAPREVIAEKRQGSTHSFFDLPLLL
jgi:hypothetical protein